MSPLFNKLLWVHIDRPLAILNGGIVVVKLREGSGTVAVENLQPVLQNSFEA
jgi:hypothetical protein